MQRGGTVLKPVVLPEWLHTSVEVSVNHIRLIVMTIFHWIVTSNMFVEWPRPCFEFYVRLISCTRTWRRKFLPACTVQKLTRISGIAGCAVRLIAFKVEESDSILVAPKSSISHVAEWTQRSKLVILLGLPGTDPQSRSPNWGQGHCPLRMSHS